MAALPFTMGDLLEIENDAAIIEAACPVTGLPVWPQIRIAVLREVLSALVYSVELTGKSTSSVSAGRQLLTMARSLMHNTLQFRTSGAPSEICVFSDGVANQEIGGKYFNRLSDYFVAAQPRRTMSVEDHFEWRWPFPRHHQAVLLHAPFQAKSALAGKIFVGKRERDQAAQVLALVDERTQRYLEWRLPPQRMAALRAMCAHKIASLPTQVAGYTRLLARLQPRLLMIGAGCYGPAAALVASARAAGIVTAEYQHGAVSPGHDAYNFAPAILASEEYRHTLPDYFLGYGEWWHTQMNAPLQKVVIGNPHRTAQLAKIAFGTYARRDVLVLSDGLGFERYVALLLRIQAAVEKSGMRLVVRPHPLERSSVMARMQSENWKFTVDINPSLYHSLSTAHVLVSEVSTGLFEAVGLVENIFMWSTARTVFTYPDSPFTAFSDADELVAMLVAGMDGKLHGANVDDIWAPDWAVRYREFLAEHNIVEEI